MQNQGTSRAHQRRRVNNSRRDGSRWGLRRVALTSVALVSFIGLGLACAYGGVGTWAQDRLMTFSAAMGYRTDYVLVDGRHYTESELLRSVADVRKGAPILAVDLNALRDKLRKIPWVRDAVVARELPNTLQISLEERRPLALWQHQGKVRVIDAGGVVLTADLRPFSTLPLVVGAGANEQAGDLLSLLRAEPDVLNRLEAAIWVGERRWDLQMKGGMLVKLPEDEIGLALKKLADSQHDDQMLDKNIAQVDLRAPDRFVVQTKPGAVEEYKASFKPGGGDI